MTATHIGAETDLLERRRRAHERLLVRPGSPAGIKERPTVWTGSDEYAQLSKHETDELARELLALGVERLSDAQALLWASDTYGLLVVFQAMDAAGKDSTIKHVMSGVNPQGVSVVSFKQPSTEELDHTFLWRIAKAVPERGRIGIFQFLRMSEDIAAIAVQHGSRDEIARAAIEGGMRSMWDDGMEKVATGLTSLEELARVLA